MTARRQAEEAERQAAEAEAQARQTAEDEHRKKYRNPGAVAQEFDPPSEGWCADLEAFEQGLNKSINKRARR